MKLLVEKSALKGTVAIPGSKSHTIRAVAIASLAEGTSKVRAPLLSGDTTSAMGCYRALGAQIDDTDQAIWKIIGTAGRPRPNRELIDIGNSGTTLRVAAGSLALANNSTPVILTGDEQIQSRPIGPLLGSLNDLGAKAVSVKGNGKAPISILGALTGGATTIECVTSQYLSSLLLAAPLASLDTEIEVTLLNEPDYVQMTLDWLDKLSIEYENDGFKRFWIRGGQEYKAFDEAVPADFSSATFFLCAGALLEGDITLTGLDFSDSQPDKAVAAYLERMGAQIRVKDREVQVKRAELQGIDIDMNRTPDALPAMAVMGAFASGTTRLLNVPQARNKETDRIACMAEELQKMGARVEELPDGLVIHHSEKLSSANFDGRHDHRIVMALAVASMALDGQSRIDTAEAMNVTFPEYLNLMKSIGARMSIE